MLNINPYTIFSLITIIVLLLYKLKWSLLYPVLSLPLLIFFFILIIGCLILSLILKDRIEFSENIKSQSIYEYKKIYGIIVIIVCIGTLLDGIYSHGFPIFGTIKHGDDFGVPFLHTFTSILASFITYYLAMVLTFGKKRNLKILLLFMLSIICIVLPFSRLLIILTLLNYFWSLLFFKGNKSKLSIKKVLTYFIILIGVLYGFGILGNYRLNVQTGVYGTDVRDSTLIYRIGVPSQKFIDSKIPSAYFWDYIYITSSLGNLQNIINEKQDENGSINEFLITQFTPDVFSKRIYPNFSTEVTENTYQYRVAPALTVGTVFFNSYYLYNYLGISMMLLFIWLFPLAYLLFLQNLGEKNFVYGLSILNTIYFLLFFDNMFTLSVLSLQLFIPLIAGIIGRSSRN